MRDCVYVFEYIKSNENFLQKRRTGKFFKLSRSIEVGMKFSKIRSISEDSKI